MNHTPWNIYPRPQFCRSSFFCLNGEWEFGIGKNVKAPIYDKKILVPFAPQSRASGLEISVDVGDILFYRTTFSLPENFSRGGEILLHFGAVDQIANVTLNGVELGKHEGGYLPFSFNIAPYLKEENTLSLVVRDDLDHTYPWGKQKRERGGMWYTPVSGIWQTVWIEAMPSSYIRSVKMTPSLTGVELIFDAPNEVEVLLDSGEVYTTVEGRVFISPKEIHLWSPENPYLYEFVAKMGEDEIKSYFALREIKSENVGGMPRLTLNGEPYFFHALLDQGYFDDGIFLPENYERMEEDIRLVKSLGFNTLRKHIKIEPLNFYHLCDKYGIVVFQDAVNNSDYSFFFDTALPTIGQLSKNDTRLHKNEKSREVFRAHTLGMIEHLYNVPSLLYYTIFNEGWGQFCADKMYRICKEADGTRIYDATSGWFLRHESDVDSRHIYFKKLSHKPYKGYKEPLPFVISEFGGYSLRMDGHTFGKDNYGYKIFSDVKALTNALLALYRDEVVPLIEDGLCATVLTQFSDVEDETNGMVTYDRELIKVDVDVMREIATLLYSKIKS